MLQRVARGAWASLRVVALAHARRAKALVEPLAPLPVARTPPLPTAAQEVASRHGRQLAPPPASTRPVLRAARPLAWAVARPSAPPHAPARPAPRAAARAVTVGRRRWQARAARWRRLDGVGSKTWGGAGHASAFVRPGVGAGATPAGHSVTACIPCIIFRGCGGARQPLFSRYGRAVPLEHPGNSP